MAEARLNVALVLTDKLSAGLQKVNKEFVSLQKTAQDFSDKMRHTSREIKQVGQDLTFFGAAIVGPMAVAFNQASKYSNDVRQSLDRLNNITAEIQVNLASNLVPIIDKLSNVLSRLANMWLSLSPSMQKFIVQGVFIGGVALAMSGIFLTLVSHITRLSGEVFKVVTAFGAFATAHPIVAAVAAAVALLVIFFDKLRPIAIPVLNIINVLLIHCYANTLLLASALARALQVSLWYIPGASKALKQFADAALKESQRARQAANIIAQAGRGPLVDMVEEGKNKLQELWEALNNPPEATNFNARLEQYVEANRRAIDELRTQWEAWNDEKTSMEMATMQRESEQLQFFIDTQQKAHQSLWTVIGKMKDQFTSGFSKILVDLMKGTVNLKEAFKELGWQMVATIVEYFVQLAVNAAMAMVMGKMVTAMTVANAATIAAAWLPAAVFASVATLGAADAAGTAGLSAAAGAGTGIYAGLAGAAKAVSAGSQVTTMAQGGTGIVDKPTLFLAGEAGAERFSFTPLSKERNQGGGGIGQVYIENASFSSDQDLEETFITLSRLIEQRKRSKI